MNKVCVEGQRMYFYRHPEPIPKSQVNFSRIEFDMDETWGSFLSVVAQFIQNGEPKNVQVKGGYCFVPPELEVGDFELCLRGDDGESVVASVNRLTLEVCEGFDPSGETHLPPSPDLYTQLVREIDSGKKIAQSVREDADSGKFNGPPGPPGPALAVTNTAAVGQTVKITAVDENDQPTEWEAVDMAERVQPDWNQNDSTAADYVRNRTHYEESTYVDYVLNMDFTGITGFPMAEVGETMSVKINGVESAETVKEAESSVLGSSYKYIGNIDIDSLVNGGTGWVVAEIRGQAVGFANPDSTISVKIIVVHKINDKFINFDGIARTFDYYFKGDLCIYKTLYDDNGNSCLLYVCDNIIVPESGSQLLGFMSEVGFSKVHSSGISSCFVTGFIFNMKPSGVVVKDTILGTDTSEMKELAAGYGYVHTTNPNA